MPPGGSRDERYVRDQPSSDEIDSFLGGYQDGQQDVEDNTETEREAAIRDPFAYFTNSNNDVDPDTNDPYTPDTPSGGSKAAAVPTIIRPSSGSSSMAVVVAVIGAVAVLLAGVAS